MRVHKMALEFSEFTSNGITKEFVSKDTDE